MRFGLLSWVVASFAAPHAFAYEQAPLKPADCRALVDANAGDPSRVDERCFQISSVRIEEAEVQSEGSALLHSNLGDLSRFASSAREGAQGAKYSQMDGALATAERIQKIAGKVWDFVKDNQPTDRISEAVVDALPEGIRQPSELVGWTTPQTREFRVVYKNLAGFDVVDFTYQVRFTAGGRIQGRKGYYLTNVQVRPGDLKVLWGFHFDFAGGALKAINVGSKDNPVAAVEVLARWRVHSVLTTLSSSESYFIKGTGSIERISAAGATLP